MGDRVAIRFVQKFQTLERISIAVFAHWGGTHFPRLAEAYFKDFYTEIPPDVMWPITRKDPDNAILNFIYWLKERGGIDYPVQSNYYLGKDFKDGDCSDNGCYDFDVDTGKIMRIIQYDWEQKRYISVEGEENLEKWQHRYDDDFDNDGFLRSLPAYGVD